LGSELSIVNPSLCEDYPVRFHYLISCRECFSYLLRGISLREGLRLVVWRGVQYLCTDNYLWQVHRVVRSNNLSLRMDIDPTRNSELSSTIIAKYKTEQLKVCWEWLFCRWSIRKHANNWLLQVGKMGIRFYLSHSYVFWLAC